MKVVITDLDGTLLDAKTYSFEPARPALETLEREGVPLVLCTSKTRAEVEVWRRRLGNTHPFIIENGGAVVVPEGYFDFHVSDVRRDGYEIIELGEPYAVLARALEAASVSSGCRVRGFHQMDLAEIRGRSHLSREEAELARKREYDEPFVILDHAGTGKLLKTIFGFGYRWTHGDIFYHILGRNDKARAARILKALYRQAHRDVVTIGLGDSLNDAGFLEESDCPVVVRSSFAIALKRAIRRAKVTHHPGPLGWNEAMLAILEQRPVTAVAV